MLPRLLTEKHLDRWLGGYARSLLTRSMTATPKARRHLLFAFCDHFEPLWGAATERVGRERAQQWLDDYPKLASDFRDGDGRRPRHTFFFPAEQYAPELLAPLAELTQRGLAEVELHLHHDGDDAPGLTRTIREALDRYASHGLLARGADGTPRYAFIHGNWCLANSRSDGRWCGVGAELRVLHDTGCYADFTFPSAPDETQPGIVNQIYWPTGDLGRPRAHERGERARVGRVRTDRILIVEGPLSLSRGGRLGVRIENAAVSAGDPPTPQRVRSWIRQRIAVAGRPEWIFVKVHTHGAPEDQAAALLGTAGRALHEALAEVANEGVVLHYVTAREMFDIARAAMDGRHGDPGELRDYVLSPPPVVS